jgi:DNA-binding HxlR family transcriptional regulator
MAIDVIGGKWKPLILRELKSGHKRYGDLQRRIPEVSQKVLTSQLRELERAGIVEREVHRENVLRTMYSLTDMVRHCVLRWKNWHAGAVGISGVCGSVKRTKTVRLATLSVRVICEWNDRPSYVHRMPMSRPPDIPIDC